MKEDLTLEIKELRSQVETLNAHRFIKIHNSMARLLLFRFASGLAFGLGTVLGGTILLSLLAYAFSSIDFLPIIGEWAAQIASEMQAAR